MSRDRLHWVKQLNESKNLPTWVNNTAVRDEESPQMCWLCYIMGGGSEDEARIERMCWAALLSLTRWLLDGKLSDYSILCSITRKEARPGLTLTRHLLDPHLSPAFA
jgi:tartrate dehydratase alpha subunit/fumarate hydratase class I-like protein